MAGAKKRNRKAIYVKAKVPLPSPVQRIRSIAVGLVSSIPDIGLSLVFLLTWNDPAHMGGAPMIANLLLVMLMEFINIHAGAVLGSLAFADGERQGRLGCLFSMGAFYLIFILGFVAGFHMWWPLWSFGLLLINRMLNILLDWRPSEEQKERITTGWRMSVILFLFFAFFTTFISFPALGMATAEMPNMLQPGDDAVWNNEPWRLMAFGFLYFGAQAIYEIVAPLFPSSRSRYNNGKS